MSTPPAFIGSTSVLCSIGGTTEQVWASHRAGIARIGSSHVMDRDFEPIQMGLVPEKALATLPPDIDALPLPSRARRMLRLAAPSFKAVAQSVPAPVRVFLGLPALTHEEAPWLKHMPAYLHVVSGVAVDREQSVIVPAGRAAGLVALERALVAVRDDPTATVVVGGVDSFLDLRLLGELVSEKRILGPRVMDGFIPGEGAAFITLSGSEAQVTLRGGQRIAVQGTVSVMDPGHRHGTEPARGEGLAIALAQLREGLTAAAPVATTFAGFNGESFDAKLWGVARLRHTDFFAQTMAIDHPADKFGDAGAATGAMLVALAAQALATRTRSGPAFVWAASDREPRACALLSVT
jgi:3-oxoacyl-[acyl-carrier-protein] synthase-1